MLYSEAIPSPLGDIFIASDGARVAGLWFAGQKYMPEIPAARECATGPEIDAARRWLELYFAGRRPDVAMVPLALGGGEFRETVYKLLLEIPYGATTTYGALARSAATRLGRERIAPQAIGGAVGHNPISIIIPCHRVLGADGGLTGYAGGLERKRWLLNREGISVGAVGARSGAAGD